MELRSDARLPFAPSLVFKVCRDEMALLQPYLPSIRSIEVTSRSENGPLVDNVIEWKAGNDIPKAMRVFMSEKTMSWTDRATWNAETLICDWRTEMHAFTRAIACGARDRFLPDGDGTLLEIRGSLVVDGAKLTGVPSFLAGRVARSMEEFLVNKIQSDLVRTGQSLTRYLEDRESGRGARPG